MKIEIHYRPSNTAAKIVLNNSDGCTTESGSMICMSPNLDINTTTYKKGKGSLLSSLKRVFAGESFFLNHYSAKGDGELWISSRLSGDMTIYPLKDSKLIIQAGSFLACDNEVNIDVNWQGFKNIFSGESLFWLCASGEGQILLNSFGAIYEVDVDGEYIVDTGHIVAFEDSLDFSLSKIGKSWLQSFLSGEGIVCRFKGRGKVYCQSHSERAFGFELRPYLRVKRR